MNIFIHMKIVVIDKVYKNQIEIWLEVWLCFLKRDITEIKHFLNIYGQIFIFKPLNYSFREFKFFSFVVKYTMAIAKSCFRKLFSMLKSNIDKSTKAFIINCCSLLILNEWTILFMNWQRVGTCKLKFI